MSLELNRNVRRSKGVKPCERCSQVAVRGQRYCRRCRKQVLAEMWEAGYLGPKPVGHIGAHRTEDQRELTYETKFGPRD